MNYDDFVNAIDEARTNGLDELESKDIYGVSYVFENHIKDMKVVGYALSGESSGGNCWGDNAHYESRSYDEDHITYALHHMIKAVAPDISYLDFVDLKKLIHFEEFTDREYYGNYREYKYSFVNYKEIFEFLEKAGYA